ncbi:hypothetical protein, partial [uncultured Rhodoblastus sp.]|uniref:hypothetical protein n=1 Tax=uncultured Rhodoblastus sp. TaxID=543037 RepID=UPI0025DC8A16
MDPSPGAFHVRLKNEEAPAKKAMFARHGRRRRQGLEQCAKKWTPVFRKNIAKTKESRVDCDS